MTKSALRVALFTHNFLEPTHHAIAAVIDALPRCEFHVFAKRRMSIEGYRLANVKTCTVGQPATDALESFDLVQAIYDGKTALGAAKKTASAGRPFVLSFHGGFDTNAKIHDVRYRDWTRRVAEYATAVTVPSPADLARLHAIGVDGRVEVIPVPVDFRRLRARRSPVRGRLVVLARLIEKKGVDTALRALRRLPAAFTLRVVGDGPMRHALESMTRTLGLPSGRVAFLGELPLWAALRELGAAAALVHSSRVAGDGNADGTPQAILWAMAMRVPVVASGAGAIEDLMAAGTRGLLVPPDDAAALAAAVTSMGDGDDETRARAERAFRYVRGHHGIRAVAARWQRLYRRVAARERA